MARHGSPPAGNGDIVVTVIIPCRNEEAFIGACLDSVIANRAAGFELEVLVVDGMSEDRTAQIVQSYTQRHPYIQLVANPRRATTAALNIGIARARGGFVVRLDAHAALDANYIQTGLRYLDQFPEAAAVGGRMVTLPRNPTFTGRAIAAALTSPFGVGSSTFRTGTEAARWVDTAFCCCYRREVFERIGGLDERVTRGEDVEFHLRLTESGGRILLVPDMICRYYIRSRFNLQFLRYYFYEGFWAVYPYKIVGTRFLKLSRLVPMAFVTALALTGIGGLWSFPLKVLFWLTCLAYASANLLAALQVAAAKRSPGFLVLLPLLFITIHVSYGLGSACAVARRTAR